jgi:hypothetical protein
MTVALEKWEIHNPYFSTLNCAVLCSTETFQIHISREYILKANKLGNADLE